MSTSGREEEDTGFSKVYSGQPRKAIPGLRHGQLPLCPCLTAVIRIASGGKSGGHLKINTRQAGRITIVDLDGPLRLGPAEDVFRSQAEQLILAGSTLLAVNLARVSDLDSSGVGALVRVFSSARRAGGKCVFFSPSQRALMVLKMVRMDKILQICEDEAAALTSF
jgi:anti-sigma B factor antagonist